MINDKRILVVDGENLLHRSYWAALPTWKDIKKEMYVYYFFNSLRSYIRIFQPTSIVCTWDYRDEGMSNHRKEILSEYKGNRVFNEEVHEFAEDIRIMLNCLGIIQIHPLNREADDIIYWLGAVKFPGKCSIVTTDTDMYQLIMPEMNGNIIWNPKKKIEVNPVYLKTNFDVDNGYQYIIKKAIRGDSSDNISGIRGMRSSKIKQVIDTLGDNYDFQALGESGVLSEEHIAILTRNLDVMRLDKLLEHSTEMEYYETQLNETPKINKELFRTYIKKFQFLEILKKFDSWFKSLSLEKSREHRSHFDHADLLQD